MRRASFNSERGAILPIVIILALALTITGLAFLNAGVTENSLVRREVYKNQAFWLAEAGLEHLLVKLKAEEHEPQIPPWVGLGDGDYMVVASYDATPPYAISTGRIEKGDQVIEKRIKQTIHITSVFAYGVLFGDQGIEMKSNVTTDSFDSEVGKYAGYPQDMGGDIGTNAIGPWAVLLDSNAIVGGNITIGRGGDPTIGYGEDPDSVITVLGNADIIGEAKPASAIQDLPKINPPWPIPDAPAPSSFFLGSNNTGEMTGSGTYSSLVLDSNAELTIGPHIVDGNVIEEPIILYVTGLMEIKSVARIKLAEDTHVVVYLGGDLFIGSNGIVNVQEVAANLEFFGLDSCNTISLDSNVDMWGAVYARKATIHVNSNADFYGSIIGYDLFVDSNGALHYDEALGRRLEGPVVVSLKDWEELPYEYKASSG